MNKYLKSRQKKHVNDTINYKNVELYVEHMSTAKNKRAQYSERTQIYRHSVTEQIRITLNYAIIIFQML